MWPLREKLPGTPKSSQTETTRSEDKSKKQPRTNEPTYTRKQTNPTTDQASIPIKTSGTREAIHQITEDHFTKIFLAFPFMSFFYAFLDPEPERSTYPNLIHPRRPAHSAGPTLLAHLWRTLAENIAFQEVFKKLILHYPDQALEKLEEVSYLLKHNDTLKLEDFLKVSDMRNYKNVCEQMTSYIAQMREHFGQKKADDDDPDAEPEAAAPVGFVPDLLEEAQVWQWAGVGFSQ